MTVRFNTVEIDRLRVFDRSGDRSAAVVLLLYGFPRASAMFRGLAAPRLASPSRPLKADLLRRRLP